MRKHTLIVALILSFNAFSFRSDIINALDIEHEHVSFKVYSGMFQSRSLTGSIFSKAYTYRVGKYPFFYSPVKVGVELFDRTREKMTEFQLSQLYFSQSRDYGHRKRFTGFGFTYIKTESLLHDIDDFIFHPYMGLMVSMNQMNMNYKPIRDGYTQLKGRSLNLGLHLLLDMAFTIKKTIEFDVKVPLRLIEINNTFINNFNEDLHSRDRRLSESQLSYLPFNMNVEVGVGWIFF